jgi:large subunit ribosomal protein L1
VAQLKQFNNTKFDQSVEIAMRLGIDPKQADQIVRGSIVLPHGIGKTLRVVVFAKGDLAEQAKSAGADEVGAEELAKKIRDGWTDFDACIASPDMMGIVGPLGRVLGPRGLMPSPRAGTVTPEVGKTVREYKAGKVEFRNDNGGIVHAVVGKLSFDAQKLVDNIQAFIQHVQNNKPASVKGHFVKSISVSATNGTLIAKMRRQETASTRYPPISGPMTSAIPDQAVQEPMAAPRSAAGNVAMMIARALGVRRAPNAPCNARPPIRNSMLGESAHKSETRPKPPTPIENTRRSPKRSPSEPPTRISDPSVSRYAFDTHCWPARPPPRSARMAGSATLTAVESSPATNEPMIAATSASCLRWLAGAATAIGPMVPTLDGYASGRSKHAAPVRRRLSTNLDQGSLIKVCR